MNRHEPIGRQGEARLRYLDSDYQVLSPGAFVVCAVTGQRIPLSELRYWSVDRQEPYVRALITSRRRDAERQATDALIRRLVDDEQLHVSATARSTGTPLHSAVEADIVGGVLLVRGMARMLHVTGGGHDG